MQSLYYGYWDYWELRHKVTFDGINKLIHVNEGVTNIDVQRDIYSAWKEWALIYDNAKYLQVINTVGGEPTVEGQFLDTTYFLINGWKLKPWSGTYTLNINGNLFEENGESIFIPADVKKIPNNININTNTSVIVRRITTTEGGAGEGLTDEERDALFNINDNIIEIKNNFNFPIEAYLEQSQADALADIQNKVRELWLIHGLDSNEALLVSKDGRSVADINQTFESSGNIVTVTRDNE